MTLSVQSQEGWLLLDHRNADPVPDQVVVAAGLPPGCGSGIAEFATFTCRHCCRVVVKHPMRKRERYFCHGCNHLLCDGCGGARAAGAACKTIDQIIDEYRESVTKNPDHPLIITGA